MTILHVIYWRGYFTVDTFFINGIIGRNLSCVLYLSDFSSPLVSHGKVVVSGCGLCSAGGRLALWGANPTQPTPAHLASLQSDITCQPQPASPSPMLVLVNISVVYKATCLAALAALYLTLVSESVSQSVGGSVSQ